MKLLDRLIVALAWPFSIIMVAGIVHISSILLMPRLAPNSAFARIAAITPLGRLVALADFAPGKAMVPFEDPAMSIGICRFDLRQGPLRLGGKFADDALVLLSFHSPSGETFFSMTDRGTSNGTLNVLVLTREQSDALDDTEDEESTPAELQVVSPANEGFVMVRALAADPASAYRAKARVNGLNCSVDNAPTT